MIRFVFSAGAVLALAACQPPIPDSRPGGVGFDNYADYQKRQLAAQQAAEQPVFGAPATAIVPPVSYAGGAATGAPTATDLAEAGIGAAPVTGGQAALPAAVPPANPQVAGATAYYPSATASAASAPVIDNTGISDEQDFAAVSSRESIASDQERLAQNRAAYQQVQPTALPARTGASEAAVDLVQYALKAPNRKGETIYPRSRIALTNSEKSCARHATPEAAQQAFLKSGGPRRDPKNLDPDGDGFACFWDPTPFQQAKN